MSFSLAASGIELVIEDAVTTRAQLRALLPTSVESVVDDELLRDAWSAAALRVLATIRNDFWHAHVGNYQIDWSGLLGEARALDREGGSVLVRAELAACLAGREEARANLRVAGYALDRANLVAFFDAQRILLEGLGQ